MIFFNPFLLNMNSQNTRHVLPFSVTFLSYRMSEDVWSLLRSVFSWPRHRLAELFSQGPEIFAQPHVILGLEKDCDPNGSYTSGLGPVTASSWESCCSSILIIPFNPIEKRILGLGHQTNWNISCGVLEYKYCQDTTVVSAMAAKYVKLHNYGHLQCTNLAIGQQSTLFAILSHFKTSWNPHWRLYQKQPWGRNQQGLFGHFFQFLQISKCLAPLHGQLWEEKMSCWA